MLKWSSKSIITYLVEKLSFCFHFYFKLFRISKISPFIIDVVHIDFSHYGFHFKQIKSDIPLTSLFLFSRKIINKNKILHHQNISSSFVDAGMTQIAELKGLNVKPHFSCFSFIA